VSKLVSVPAADNLRHLDMAPTEAVYDEWLTTAADLLEAIDALHQPEHPDPDFFPSYTQCVECSKFGMSIDWPCPTARLLHPEVQP
jgi:hypothetical protein